MAGSTGLDIRSARISFLNMLITIMETGADGVYGCHSSQVH